VLDGVNEREAVFARAATILAHDERFSGDPVVPPIFQTSLFTFASYRDMEDAFAGRVRRPIYSRGDNPTVRQFEERLAALEGAEAARAFSSGMGAISATVLAFAGAGSRVVAVRHVYPDTYRLFQQLCRRLSISVDYVDGADADAVAAALPGASLLYLESPTSMVFEVQDLERIATLARAAGVVTIIDNSWATPLFQQPLRHGIDLVLHSASKYIGGHSDTVAGIVAGSAALVGRINAETYSYLGAKLSPFEAWLLLRGLRTLPLRMRAHEKSAVTLAERLKGHPQVVAVHHPAFSNHPGRRTLLGFSGLFSFEVGEAIDIAALVDALRYFKLGVSWGGHESLAVPVQASMAQTPKLNAQVAFGVSPRTIRISVGHEDTEDLWADLARALDTARR